MALSSSIFWAALLCAAAVLAIWLDVRVPRLEAASLQAAVFHAAAALLVITLVVPALSQLLLAWSETLLTIEAAAIGIVLPGFTYSLLAALWLVKLSRRALAGDLR